MILSARQQPRHSHHRFTGRWRGWGAVALAWCLRLVALGAAVGLLIGAGGQVAILVLAPSSHGASDPTVMQRVVGVIWTALGYAAVGLVVGVLTSTWVRSSLGRWIGALLCTTVLTVLFAANVVSVAIRILAGTHVTLGALEFCLNSPQHFVHAAIEGYAWSVRGVLVLVGAFALVTAVHLLRSLRAPGAPPLRSLGTILAGIALSMLVVIPGPAHATLDARVFTSTPELALAHSLRHASDLGNLERLGGTSEVRAVEPGPPLAAAGLWEVAVRENTGPRPNVLLLTLESVALPHLGWEGYRRGVTPNLDVLAKHGLRFRRAWTTATHSNYAQMAILSSLFPRRGAQLDMYDNLDYPRLLPHDLFHRLGYATGTISSQDETWQGMRRFQDTETPTTFWDANSYSGERMDTGTERIVPDSMTVERVKHWLQAHQGRRWALYVNLQSTHFPYRIQEGEEAPFRPHEPRASTFTYLRYPEAEREVVRNRYDNALAYVDRQIGRLRNYLAATSQLEDTLWIITSDHGELFHEHQLVTHGRSLFEGETRVPLVMHWPKGIRARDVTEPVSHLDIMPTVTHLLGIPPHPSYQGRNLLGDPLSQPPAIFMNIQGLRFVDGVICYPWKLIYDHTGRTAYLYRLDGDPAELHNLAQERPRVAASLGALLAAQVKAQLAYHGEDDRARRRQHAPRLLSCPAIEEASSPGRP